MVRNIIKIPKTRLRFLDELMFNQRNLQRKETNKQRIQPNQNEINQYATTNPSIKTIAIPESKILTEIERMKVHDLCTLNKIAPAY